MTIELVTPEPVEGEEEERIELFSLDGTSYTVPVTVRPNISLQYLYLARVEGVAIAESWLAEQLLGAEAYLALINFEHLKQEQYDDVLKAARDVVFGDGAPKAGTKSKRKSTSKKSAGSSTSSTESTPTS